MNEYLKIKYNIGNRKIGNFYILLCYHFKVFDFFIFIFAIYFVWFVCFLLVAYIHINNTIAI